jgi:hypothetical protein
LVNDHRGSQYPIFFDGRFSHAVLKWAKAGDCRVQEEFGSRTEAAVALPRLIEEVTHIVRLLVESLLFARVDSIEVHRWLWLMGLELIEPQLFFGYDREAPQRFADAIILLC